MFHENTDGTNMEWQLSVQNEIDCDMSAMLGPLLKYSRPSTSTYYQQESQDVVQEINDIWDIDWLEFLFPTGAGKESKHDKFQRKIRKVKNKMKSWHH